MPSASLDRRAVQDGARHARRGAPFGHAPGAAPVRAAGGRSDRSSHRPIAGGGARRGPRAASHRKAPPPGPTAVTRPVPAAPHPAPAAGRTACARPDGRTPDRASRRGPRRPGPSPDAAPTRVPARLSRLGPAKGIAPRRQRRVDRATARASHVRRIDAHCTAPTQGRPGTSGGMAAGRRAVRLRRCGRPRTTAGSTRRPSFEPGGEQAAALRDRRSGRTRTLRRAPLLATRGTGRRALPWPTTRMIQTTARRDVPPFRPRGQRFAVQCLGRRPMRSQTTARPDVPRAPGPRGEWVAMPRLGRRATRSRTPGGGGRGGRAAEPPAPSSGDAFGGAPVPRTRPRRRDARVEGPTARRARARTGDRRTAGSGSENGQRPGPSTGATRRRVASRPRPRPQRVAAGRPDGPGLDRHAAPLQDAIFAPPHSRGGPASPWNA